MCRGVNGVVTAMCTPTFSCRGGFSLAATEGCTGLGMASGVMRDGLGFNYDCGGGGCGCCGETAGLFELSTYLFLFDVLHAVGYFYFFDQLTQPVCVCARE